MTASKFTTTPSPIEVVEKVNAVIDDVATANTNISNKLGKTEKAASATSADSAATLSATLPVNKGGTGATTKAGAQTALGLNDAIVGLSVSGRTITYTQADGGTGTITTQDTDTKGISLNMSGKVALTTGTSWTATGNGMVNFELLSNSSWGGGSLTLNGVAVTIPRAKESGAVASVFVKTGDVVVSATIGGISSTAVYFIPFN